MEQTLKLKTKANTDSIITTNHLLSTLNINSCVVLTNGAMTVKQYDFMTFIFKGLQMMVNNLNNTEITELLDFRDLDIEDKINYIQQNRPFLKVDVETILPFLQTTNTGNTRRVTKREALDYIEQLRELGNKMYISNTIKNEDSTTIKSINLFSTASVDATDESDELLYIKTFDLLINLEAIPYILTLFDYKNNSYGHTQIRTILKLKSVNSKNLHYYICRYMNLINSYNGFKVNVSTLTKYLGIDKQIRPYKQLLQIVQYYNKEMADTGTKITITSCKKGKKGQILQVILKLEQTTEQLQYKNTNNTDHSNCNNENDVWF